jgi:hypothetical protein
MAADPKAFLLGRQHLRDISRRKKIQFLSEKFSGSKETSVGSNARNPAPKSALSDITPARLGFAYREMVKCIFRAMVSIRNILSLNIFSNLK